MTTTADHDVHQLDRLVRSTRPGERLVVTVGPVQPTEWVAFTLGAVHAVAPRAQPPARWIDAADAADGRAVQHHLARAGLHDVREETVTWAIRFRSADDVLHLARTVPLVRQDLDRLTDEQDAGVRQVLAGMLRERSGGLPGAVLSARVRIVVGTVPPTNQETGKERA